MTQLVWYAGPTGLPREVALCKFCVDPEHEFAKETYSRVYCINTKFAVEAIGAQLCVDS